MFKKILLIIGALFIALQFVRPTRNKSNAISENDISKHYPIPDTIHSMLKSSCYDCHSNNTIYPWYTNIQPVGLWMQNHVNGAKRGLNFSEFTSYKPAEQMNKLKKVVSEIKKDDMPLNSYLWIHRYAILSDNQKLMLINWADTLKNQIGRMYNITEAEVDKYD